MASLLYRQFLGKTFRLMGGFSADKTSAKMLSKMTAVVHGSHSDESHEKPLERIYLVKANHPRWTSLEESHLTLTNAVSRPERRILFEASRRA